MTRTKTWKRNASHLAEGAYAMFGSLSYRPMVYIANGKRVDGLVADRLALIRDLENITMEQGKFVVKVNVGPKAKGDHVKLIVRSNPNLPSIKRG